MRYLKVFSLLLILILINCSVAAETISSDILDIGSKAPYFELTGYEKGTTNNNKLWSRLGKVIYTIR